MQDAVDESLRKICRYQRNKSQHYYPLDTLVIIIWLLFVTDISRALIGEA